MRACSLPKLTLALLSLVVLSVSSPAAEFRSGQEVVIKADEVIDDDLYCFGEKVTIDGTVEGDVVVFGSQITVNGTVSGHIMAAGQTVVLTGKSAGARVAGQVLKLGDWAKLDGDLIGAGLSLECSKDSVIDGDAVFAGYQALFAGRVAEDLTGALANCRLAGPIGGDVKLDVGSDKNAPSASTFGPPPPVAMPNVPGGLTLGEGAQVEGDLVYESSAEAEIDAKAKVEGKTVHNRPKPKEKAEAKPARNPFVVATLTRLRHIVSVLLVGIFALVVLPRATESWAKTIRERPGAAFVSGALGLAAFIAVLIVAAVLIVTGAILLGIATLGELIPAVLIGGMVGSAALVVGFWVVWAFLAEALIGLAVGGVAFRESSFANRLIALLIGVVIVGLVLSVPYLGGLIGFVVVLLALGSICLWLVGQAPPQSFAVLPAPKPQPATII